MHHSVGAEEGLTLGNGEGAPLGPALGRGEGCLVAVGVVLGDAVIEG